MAGTSKRLALRPISDHPPSPGLARSLLVPFRAGLCQVSDVITAGGVVKQQRLFTTPDSAKHDDVLIKSDNPYDLGHRFMKFHEAGTHNKLRRWTRHRRTQRPSSSGSANSGDKK